MKKIINQPESAVLEMCHGIACANPNLEFVEKYKVLKKRLPDKQKVTLISGGGCGHEPAHAGFIGKGMLDAAVCGDVFASPSQIQVYKAIQETAGEKGTLLIIKNYSGDMMNFKNAAHLAKEDGLQVDYVKVDDDIAVQDSLYTVGRRGVAGTVLVHKIAGAAAEAGLSLQEVKAAAEKAVKNVKSIGFAFSSCTVPAKGTPTFHLEADQMEYGVGIHGEPGIAREEALSSDELAERMTAALLQELDLNSAINIEGNTEIALLVNGFGGTPLLELYILNHSVMEILTQKGIKVSRIFVGNFMTSIEMQGASVSMMKLDAELKQYLSAPSEAPAFMVTGKERDVAYVPLAKAADFGSGADGSPKSELPVVEDAFREIYDNQISLQNMIYIVKQMSDVIISHEVEFCELDAHAGDGDFGMSVAKGFRRLMAEWPEVMEHTSSIGAFLEECSLIIMEHCGGASGPIWGSAFRAAGKYAGARQQLSVSEFAQLLQAAVNGIQSTGERSFGRGAVVGDKTLIDALVPCTDAWLAAADQTDIRTVFEAGAQAAVDGAKKTEAIVARMGRAGTVGERSIGFPDAGAYALGVIFTEIYEAMFR